MLIDLGLIFWEMRNYYLPLITTCYSCLTGEFDGEVTIRQSVLEICVHSSSRQIALINSSKVSSHLGKHLQMPNTHRNATTAPKYAIKYLSSINTIPIIPNTNPQKCGVSPNQDPQWPTMPAIKRNRCSMHACPHGGQGLTHAMLAPPSKIVHAVSPA